MLNKEVLIGLRQRKKQEPVVMRLGFDGEYRHVGYGPDYSNSHLSKVPYWTFGMGLGRLYLYEFGSDSWWMLGGGIVLKNQSGPFTPTKTVQLSITIKELIGRPGVFNGKGTFVATFPAQQVSSGKGRWVGEFSGQEEYLLAELHEYSETGTLTFEPPPPTGIYRRCQRRLLRGGGVNAGERSTTAFDEKERADAEHTQWVGRCDGDHVLQRQDIYELERFRFSISESQNSHFIAGGGKGDLRRRSVGQLWTNSEECQEGHAHFHTLFLHHRPNQRCGNPLVGSCLDGGANA